MPNWTVEMGRISTKIILVCINDYTKQLKKELQKKNIDAQLLPSFHYATPKNIWKTFTLRKQGYNIIHFGWLYAFPSQYIMKFYVKLAKRLGYKLIYEVQNIKPHEKKFGGKNKINWWYKNMDHLFLQHPSSVNRIKKELGIDITSTEYCDYTVMFLPNWGDRYENAINKQEARKILKISPEKKFILSFGMIKLYKGMEIFADIMEELYMIDKSYYGMVAGIPHDMDVVHYLKKKSLKLDNFDVMPKEIPDNEIQIYMNAADCVILPYTVTNLASSGVLNLAYTFHRPVIATWYPSLEGILTNDRGLLIQNPFDHQEIIQRIEELFSMDYEKMGETAYKYIETQTWDKLTSLMIKNYKELSEV